MGKDRRISHPQHPILYFDPSAGHQLALEWVGAVGFTILGLAFSLAT
jgi:hypothetical protein